MARNRMLTWRALPRPMRSTAVFVRPGLEPMARGFIYLAAVLDWFTRRVLAWRVAARQLVTVLPPIPGSRVRDQACFNLPMPGAVAE